MKRLYLKIIALVFMFVVVVLFSKDVYAYAQRWLSFSFCDRPTKYKVVRVDNQFEITREDFIKEIDKAGYVWGDIVQKKLFEYDESGYLKINLVYDTRQDYLRTINELNKDVEKQKQLLDNKSNVYSAQQSDLEKELKKLNDTIDYWNAKGGAPHDVYDDLVKKQKELKQKIDQLNQSANNINNKVGEINQEIHDLNEKVTNFNSLIKVSPEMGLYTSGINQIDIYFFGDKNELTHVLAHELGHSLGLQHSEAPDAIMNPITSGNTAPTQSDISAINNLCNNKNRLDLIKSDIQNYMYSVMSHLYFKLQNFK
jgi:peptidoglycan hydrolase CwlO-like protein